MRYALLMYADPAHTRAMSEGELEVVMRKHEALRNELTESGELAGGEGLVLPDETTLVRPGGAQRSPLAAGATEHLTAWYVVECAGDNRARSLAEHLLDDHVTAVEVRLIHDSAGR